MAIDEASKTDLFLFKAANANPSDLLKYGNHRAEFGNESALPLFRKIKFNWISEAKNPIGDMMAFDIFSPRAVEVMKPLNIDAYLFEPIDIEGTPAFKINANKHEKLTDDYDLYSLHAHRGKYVCSERFKLTWEAAGLLGAEFTQIDYI